MAIITDGVRTKFTDDTGLPLIGGQVFSYVEGTSTPKDTYRDRAFTIPNTNPITLDDIGSCQMYLKGGYRLRVLTADGVLVEEKDNAFQSDGQVLDVVANTTAIAALQTNVDVLNTRGGLKTDENNHIIGQGKAESATVYDLSFRSDKIRVSAPTDVEFGDLVFKTYAAPTVVNGVTVPKGTWLNPALVTPLLGTAASKSIGTATGQIPLAEDTLKAAYTAKATVNSDIVDANTLGAGTLVTLYNSKLTNGPSPAFVNNWSTISTRQVGDFAGAALFQEIFGYNIAQYAFRVRGIEGNWRAWEVPYTTRNATKDANGFLKGASPIVKVFADKVELNGEAVDQDVSYKKNGVGDYTITTVSGLSTDGWYIELPKDMNGNPKVAVTLSEVDGMISLKTYKRIFSMETFTFEPDLDNPLDIPDTRWIDLRLNEDVEQSEQPTP